VHPLGRALADRDTDALPALLADDVVLTSPIAFKPYVGKAITVAVIRGVMRVFENFCYVREIADVDGRDHALIFEATVSGKKITGCDFLHVNDDGRVDDLVVMARPLSATTAFAEAMSAQYDEILRDAENRIPQ
jgi:hypothetical protein